MNLQLINYLPTVNKLTKPPSFINYNLHNISRKDESPIALRVGHASTSLSFPAVPWADPMEHSVQHHEP